MAQFDVEVMIHPAPIMSVLTVEADNVDEALDKAEETALLHAEVDGVDVMNMSVGLANRF